ncbi:MAG: hypothetical protein EXR69_11510 [Myxococcales bacterium]|nr:hypothetical protein [Myxococcales bacterium]
MRLRKLTRLLPPPSVLALSLGALSALASGCRTEAKPDGTGDPPIGVDSEGEDFDGDSYITTAAGGDDCDDGNAAVNPGVAEVTYDGIDNDCDVATPDDDLDADGYPLAVDCADEDATINPTVLEICDGLDNDCDGAVDNAPDAPTWYADGDGDGYGDDLESTTACEAPDGYADIAGDCDDRDAAYHPGADESDCADPNDYNCDGSVGYADADADGFPACEDCDDASVAVNPDGTETCNGLDDDCDSVIDDYAVDAPTWYEDGDADSYGLDSSSLTQCDAPAGYAADPGDCDDSDAAYNPAASESCSDPNDYNCDGSVGYTDNDADGFAACDECDDSDGAVNPSAAEVCNGIDDDCDGTIDGADSSGATTWYLDLDADGYGDDATAVVGCDAPTYHVATGGDCDDHNNDISPDGVEVCDGEDNDCNGEVDEAGGATLYYTDADSDGYGDDATSEAACDAPTGSVANAGDCDDGDANYHPSAPESCTDTVDYNCDGSIGLVDVDGDGWAACEECDDSLASVNPGGIEVCNGVDDDCDGAIDDAASDMTPWFEDSDRDGYGSTVSVTECDAPAGYIADSGDCDDANRRINPSATEVCDSIDNDCDGLTDDASAVDSSLWYADADADGYGDPALSAEQCDAPAGYVGDDADCDDADATVYPTAPETCLDTTDKNCDGASGYSDADGDGYAACEDCDDTSAARYPGAIEVCDDLDNDCNGAIDDGTTDAVDWYQDTDTDGYGSAVSTTACDQPSGYTSETGDCNDSSRGVNPSAAEICDTIDNNCDGLTDGADASGATSWFMDADTDGYGDPTVAETSCAASAGYVDDATDCDDTDSTVYPSAPETCLDTTDKNCDGSAGYSDDDGDGYAACEECNDNSAVSYPGAVEVCDDLDNDCDGAVDDSATDASTWFEDNDTDGYGSSVDLDSCDKPSGYSSETGDCDDGNRRVSPSAAEICDSVDNDCDGLTDGADAAGARSWYADSDADGYGDPAVAETSCDAPFGHVGNADDCDDANASANPIETEHCNGFDDDCDGLTDDSSSVDATTYYTDADSDGYGSAVGVACTPPSGSVSVSGDCNDANATINPAETDTCDYVDNNCSGLSDESYRSGTKYVLETDCGSCDNDCSTYSYDNASPFCDTTRSTPICDYTCDAGYYDVNGAQADGCECLYASATDAPFDGLDADCDGSDGPPTDAIYVSTSGSPTASGDISDPVDTVQGGIDLAEASGMDYVLVSEGTYAENVVLVDGINVYGGYDTTFANRDIGSYTTRIDGSGADAANPATVLASGISSATIFEGFTVMGNAASGYGEAAVAMWIEECTDGLVVRSNHIEAGAGRDGADGTNGSGGTEGADGAAGATASTGDCSSLPAGGAGGANTCGGVATSGGSGAGSTCPSSGVYQPSGDAGVPSGGGGGAGACSAVIYDSGCGTAYISDCWDGGADAAYGVDGEAGDGGAGAADQDGEVSAGYWTGEGGADGTDGDYGVGGGGGGTGSGVDVGASCGSMQYGGTGGGGGAGGCGGAPGVGGKAGGASVGLIISYGASATVFPVFEDNEIVGGNGGFGGDGGDGGDGGAGGLGAAGGARETSGAWAAQSGGAGGFGGGGGGGGGAGGGAGGPSYGALVFGATPDPGWLSAENTVSHGTAGSKGRGGIGGDSAAGDGADGANGTSGNQNW